MLRARRTAPHRRILAWWLALVVAALVQIGTAATCAAQSAPDTVGTSPRAAADSAGVAADSTRAPVPAAATPPVDSVRVAADSIAARVIPLPTRPLGVADTVTVLPPVSVHGERRGLAPDRETATSVRLDRAGVTRFLPTTAADALLAVPGVDLVKTGPWASRVSYRGFSGERVLVMVDGVRVNTVRGHGAQASLVPVDQLDEVELLPGATSAQFGSDALGGVINMVTHRSLFSPSSDVDVAAMARGSSPGESWAQSARVRHRSRDWGFEFSGGLGSLDALVTPDGRVPQSGYREQHVGGRVGARIGAAVLDLEHTRLAAYDIGLPAFADAAGSHASYPLQARDATRFELAFAPQQGWPAARLLAVRQQFETRFEETAVESAFVRGRYVGTVTNEAADHVTSPAWSVMPELRFGGVGHLRLNAEWRLEETSGPRQTTNTVRNASGATTSQTTGLGESVPPARRDVWAASAFASERVAGFRVEAGARWDALRSRADSTANSPTARLDVMDRRASVEGGLSHPLGVVEPYAHVATGFRAPNLQERYFNDEVHGGMQLFGNPDLTAERSLSYELGMRTADAWGGRVRSARVSVYRSDVDDMITIVYLGQLYLVPRFQYANVERARLEGIEGSAQLQLGPLQAGLAAGLPRGIDLATGEKLIDAGTARATLDLSVPLRLLPHGRLSTRLRWNDAITGVDSTVARPAFSTIALEASTLFAGMRAVFAVTNLLDHRYAEPMSFIPEPGRTFAVSLRRDFDIPLVRDRSTP